MPLRKWLKMGLMQKILVKTKNKLIIRSRRIPTCCQTLLPKHPNLEKMVECCTLFAVLTGTQMTSELLVATAAGDSLEVVAFPGMVL